MKLQNYLILPIFICSASPLSAASLSMASSMASTSSASTGMANVQSSAESKHEVESKAKGQAQEAFVVHEVEQKWACSRRISVHMKGGVDAATDGHGHFVYKNIISPSPDGKRLLVVQLEMCSGWSYEYVAKLFNLETGELVRAYDVPQAAFSTDEKPIILWSHDSKHVVMRGSGKIVVFDVSDGYFLRYDQCDQELWEKEAGIYRRKFGINCVWAPAGPYVLIQWDTSVLLYDIEDQKRLGNLVFPKKNGACFVVEDACDNDRSDFGTWNLDGTCVAFLQKINNADLRSEQTYKVVLYQRIGKKWNLLPKVKSEVKAIAWLNNRTLIIVDDAGIKRVDVATGNEAPVIDQEHLFPKECTYESLDGILSPMAVELVKIIFCYLPPKDRFGKRRIEALICDKRGEKIAVKYGGRGSFKTNPEASNNDESFKVIDAASGVILWQQAGCEPWKPQFSPDGSRLINLSSFPTLYNLTRMINEKRRLSRYNDIPGFTVQLPFANNWARVVDHHDDILLFRSTHGSGCFAGDEVPEQVKLYDTANNQISTFCDSMRSDKEVALINGGKSLMSYDHATKSKDALLRIELFEPVQGQQVPAQTKEIAIVDDRHDVRDYPSRIRRFWRWFSRPTIYGPLVGLIACVGAAAGGYYWRWKKHCLPLVV